MVSRFQTNSRLLQLASRTGVETERFTGDGPSGFMGRAGARISGASGGGEALNLTQQIGNKLVENDTKIIERRLRDVCDPLSEVNESLGSGEEP